MRGLSLVPRNGSGNGADFLGIRRSKRRRRKRANEEEEERSCKVGMGARFLIAGYSILWSTKPEYDMKAGYQEQNTRVIWINRFFI